MFGMSELGSIDPTKRYKAARDRLEKARQAYATAQTELIAAGREVERTEKEWEQFHFRGFRQQVE